MKMLLCGVLIFALAFPGFAASRTGTESQVVKTTTVSLPKDFEKGFRVAMQVAKEMGLVEDHEKTNRLSEIGYRVAQRAAPDLPHFSFRIVKMEEPNAFALPGGFIFVSSGMLDLNLTDDELAALLGHEIIHVKNEHSRKMGKRQTVMNLLYQALVIGLAVGLRDGGAPRDPITGLPTRSPKSEILQGSAAFGLIFQELLLRGFSRELEIEADQEGMIASTRAGFSSGGTSNLFEKMRQRTYEVPGFGYWRTHPYLEDRMEAARVLAPTFEAAKNPADATEYRKQSQKTFVNLLEKFKEPEEKRILRKLALQAYPIGTSADELRWWFIRDAEQEENKKEPFFRDLGKLTRLYEESIEEIKKNETSKDLLAKLEKNLTALQEDTRKVAPLYEEVMSKQNFDTEMLQRYLSNFPDSPRLPEVRFRLAENYRLLKKNKEAVDLYLKLLDSQNAWTDSSRQSLLQLLPHLEDLSSCYKLTKQNKSAEVQKAASERMKMLAGSFKSLQNGYEFRREYPTSEYEKTVRSQMTKLASTTFNQARLYQAVGEYQKALDQYNQILRYCSDLPVADEVKDTIVDIQEVTS